MTKKSHFDNIEVLDPLNDVTLRKVFNSLDEASRAQLNATAPFENSLIGAGSRAYDMANEIGDAHREGRPVESVTPDWTPDGVGGPDLKGEVVDKALDQAGKLGENVEGLKGFKSGLGKLTGGLPGEIMDRVNEFVENSPLHSHQDTVPNIVDHVIAKGVNEQLTVIQKEAGVPLDDQFRVTAKMYDGPSHEQLNVMIGVADRMDAPEMREGLFERMLEMQERHAADKTSHATPALEEMRKLDGREGLDSVDKLDNFISWSESYGIYNSHGGELTYDKSGMPERNMDILGAASYDHEWIEAHGEPTDHGTYMLSVRDANDYYHGQVDAGELHTDSRPGFEEVFASDDFSQAVTALNRDTISRHGGGKIVEVQLGESDHAHDSNAAGALSGLLQAGDPKSTPFKDIIADLENARDLETVSFQAEMRTTYDPSIYRDTGNDEHDYGVD